MLIHQVYGIFNDGIGLDEIPIFKENVEETIDICKKLGYTHKIWNLKDCQDLIDQDFPDYKKLWRDFRYSIQQADFIRYCILYKFGGLYIDCDIRPVKNLERIFNEPQYFVYWANDKKKLPYNAVMGSHKNNKLFLEIMSGCKKDFYEKSKNKTYEKWKGRFIFQTTGHFAIERVIKKQKIDKDKYFFDHLYIRNDKKHSDVGNCITALFYDANASLWMDNLI